MNTQITFASLKARPVRTAVGVMAVTLEVVLILMLVGLTNGTINETGRRVEGVGAEVLLKPENSSFFLGMNPAILPIKELGGDLAKVDVVQAVAPVVTQMDISGGFTVVYGIDPPSFDAVSGGFRILEGRMFSAPDEAVIDDWQAGTKMISIGQRVSILKHTFTVTGIVENGKGARIFVPIHTAQEMVHQPDSATMFYVKLKNKDQTKEGIEKLKEVLPGYDIVDVKEFVSLMFGSLSTLLDAFFKVVVFLGVSIGVLVIFLSMYTTVTERTREIGILRSMGASKLFIVNLVLQESLVLCVAGTIVGIGFSLVLTVLLKKLMPTLIVLITPSWVVRAIVLALISGIVGSLYPAYKAASQDPIESLAYE